MENRPMAPRAVVGNVQVVAPLLRLVLAAAISPDPVAVPTVWPHKGTAALFLLLLLTALFCHTTPVFA